MISLDFQTNYITIGDTTAADVAQDYPKGDHFFYIQYGDFAEVEIWSRIIGKAVIPRRAYNQIYNVSTSAPFASSTELRDALRANFFIEMAGGGTTPTLKVVTRAGAEADDNSAVFNPSIGPFYIGTIAGVGDVMKAVSPNEITLGNATVFGRPLVSLKRVSGDYSAKISINNSFLKLSSDVGDMFNVNVSNGGPAAEISVQEEIVYISAGTSKIKIDTNSGYPVISVEGAPLRVDNLTNGGGRIAGLQADGTLTAQLTIKDEAGADRIDWNHGTPEGGTHHDLMILGDQRAFMLKEGADGPGKVHGTVIAGTAYSAFDVEGFIRVALYDNAGTYLRTVKILTSPDV